MYEEYWKLKCRPFHNTSDPRFFYHSSRHDEVLMKLVYVINENLGAAMLTGPYGCGKTMLSRVLISQLNGSKVAKTATAQPDMTPLDLLRNIARAMTEKELSYERSNLVGDALLEIIERVVNENHRDGKHIVLVLDEAHMLDNQTTLETLRLLLNLQSQDEFLLTLLLLGQPELAERVASLKQLAQRIPVTCSLGSFQPEDTAKYVQSRIAVAGGAAVVFNAAALDLIHRNSGGIPRRINTLCDACLTLGFAKQAQSIGPDIVLEAAEKFGIA